MGESPWKFESSRPHQSISSKHRFSPSGVCASPEQAMDHMDHCPGSEKRRPYWRRFSARAGGFGGSTIGKSQRDNNMLRQCRTTRGRTGREDPAHDERATGVDAPCKLARQSRVVSLTFRSMPVEQGSLGVIATVSGTRNCHRNPHAPPRQPADQGRVHSPHPQKTSARADCPAG